MTNMPKGVRVPTTEGAYALLFDGCPNEEFEVPGANLEFDTFYPEGLSGSPVSSIGVYDKANKLYGAIVARGLVSAQVSGSGEEQSLVFHAYWPKTQAWGLGQQDFLKDRAAVQCVLRYASEAFRVFSRTAPQAAVWFTFEGNWEDESFSSLKTKIVKEFNALRFSTAKSLPKPEIASGPPLYFQG